MEEPQYKIFQTRTCTLDFNEVKTELLNLFRSRNIFSLFTNSAKIKDKFGEFINCISARIVNGFNVEGDNKTLMYRIYKDAGYDKVWISLLSDFIMESKYFDVLRYAIYMKHLSKEKQYLAVGLFKLYHKVPKIEIEAYLKKFSDGKVTYSKIQQIYDDFELSGVLLIKPVTENHVESFIEQIYNGLGKRGGEFLERFSFKINLTKSDFKDMLKVMFYIFSSYSCEGLDSVIPANRSKKLKDTKAALELLLVDYQKDKYSFYAKVRELTQDLEIDERNTVWKYLRMAMIEKYFPKVRYLYYFYSSKDLCDKNTFTQLKGTLSSVPHVNEKGEIERGVVSPEANAYFDELQEIYDLKEIILTLYDNLFGSFLLPLVYYTIGERLVIKKEDLGKMKYLLLFVFADNYSEYKKMYLFFNQLEVFLNFEEKPRVYEKLKVGFSYFVASVLIMLASYMFLPLGVSLGMFILMIIKGFEILYPNNFYRLRRNVGLKFFAYLFLLVSGYYWIMNFDATSEQVIAVQKQFEFFATYPTREAGEYVTTSVLEYMKK